MATYGYRWPSLDRDGLWLEWRKHVRPRSTSGAGSHEPQYDDGRRSAGTPREVGSRRGHLSIARLCWL